MMVAKSSYAGKGFWSVREGQEKRYMLGAAWAGKEGSGKLLER